MMIVPVTVTYAPDFRDAAEVGKARANDVNGMVNAVFDYMVDHGTPYDPDTIDGGNYGDELEPYRESLTLFITAWHNLAFAYGNGSSNNTNGAPDRKISSWKLRALRALFKPKNT